MSTGSNRKIISTPNSITSDLQGGHEALSQQALSISSVLQTTLDVYSVVQQFARNLAMLVPLDGFFYAHKPTSHNYETGKKAEHQCHYNLKLNESELGCLEIHREVPFTEEEVQTLENALAALMYPLKNAYQYHQAILHSQIDPLTKLGNRLSLDKSLRREIDFCQRHDTPLSLMMIDIDHFKSINDQFGHLTGDATLIQLSQLLCKNQRNTDMIFRFGGEEFIIIMAQTTVQAAQQVAIRLKDEIQQNVFTYKNHQVTFTVSIGIAQCLVTDEMDDFLNRADLALYDAKHNGRNRVNIAQ